MLRKISLKLDKEKFLSRVTKISVFVWLACILGVFAIIGYVVGVRKELFDKAPDVFVFSLLGLILLGCLAFLVGTVSFTAQLIAKRSQKKQNIFIFLTKLFFVLAILPLYLLVYLLKPLEIIRRLKHSGFKGLLKSLRLRPMLGKIIALVLVGAIIFPIWIGGFATFGAMVASQLGYITEAINIGGTGSMYPTFPKGQGKTLQEQAKEVVGSSGMFPYPNGLVFFGQRFFGHQVDRGDIVVLENDMLREYNKKLLGEESGWVKRVVAVSGDALELRDGIVYLNNQPLKEPYIAKARSTFGESFLKECQKVTVPNNSVFVMGDNRKGSGDSREVGFFSVNDVKYALPLKSQKGDLVKHWRDTSKDFDESSKIKLDKEKLLELLNSKRKEAGLRPIKYQPKLEQSANKRGEVMLKYDDFSYEATKSGYPIERAMRDVGYSNVVWNEGIIQGHFEAEELMEYFFEFPDWKKNLFLNKDLQEVGVAEVERADGCSTHAVVMHFAGYVPPNYKTEDIESWKINLTRLKEIQPGWAGLKDNLNFYQKNKADVDRINEIISIRIANISTIVAKMEANQWLTAAEQKMIDQDKPLYDELEAIATRLNSR